MKLHPASTWVLVLVLVLPAATAVKVYLNARGELARAESLVAKNRWKEAVPHYERAVQWFIPFSDVTDQAAEGLWKTAARLESLGDVENALNAYRLLRGAFYSARSFYTPGRDWINRCNEKIASLMARQAPGTESEKAKSFEQRRTEALALLAAEKPPHAPWALLAEIGFAGWVGCGFLFIVRALTRGGEIKSRPALLWGGGFILFYGLWLLGMAYV